MLELLLSTEQVKHEGSEELIAGTLEYGYYGRAVSGEMPNTSQLTDLLVTNPNGTVSDANPVWYKFSLDNKTLYIPQKPLRVNTTWNSIDAAGAVSGKTIIWNGNQYLVRLIRGADTNPATTAANGSTVNPAGSLNSEWNKLIYAIHSAHPSPAPAWADLSNTDMMIGGAGTTASWCMESYASNNAQALHRGYNEVRSYNYNSKTAGSPSMNWRPLIELVGPVT